MSTEIQKPSRIITVDVARALAVIFMVQGHTLDVLLAPAFREGGFFNCWLFLRGLTAPMFLTLSGFSFIVVSSRRWESFTSATSALKHRIFRFSFLICIGYLMHLPVRNPLDIRWMHAESWAQWAQIDVLQCIGLTLLLLQCLILVTRTPKAFGFSIFALGVLAVVTTPLLWKAAWLNLLPNMVSAYVDGARGAVFPVFPWAGYIIGGALLGLFYTWKRNGSAAPVFAVCGLSMAIVGFAIDQMMAHAVRDLHFWRTSPHLFLMRFGGVMVILSIIDWAAKWQPFPQRVVQTLAKESLFVYVLHLFILYGSVWNSGLRQEIGATLGPVATITCILLLLALVIPMALGWHSLKQALSAKPKAQAAPKRESRALPRAIPLES